LETFEVKNVRDEEEEVGCRCDVKV